MYRSLKTVVKRLYTPKMIQNIGLFATRLTKDKLHIADVGSTGGPEKRWDPFQGFCHFYSFDPDPRATALSSHSMEVFAKGLWENKEKRSLYLSKFPPASSVFEFHPNLQVFLNRSCHEVVKTESIEMETMESVLQQYPSPDFIKVDAEGADLAILKGAQRFLHTSCLGIQVEVSLNPRHIKAPLFPEVDSFLREAGFQIFDLRKHRWIRFNETFGFYSKPQLVWGDAIYFLSKEKVLLRLKQIESESAREVLLTKFLILTLVYRLHDFAVEVIEDSFQEGMLQVDFYSQCLHQIRYCASRRWGYLARVCLAISLGGLASLIFLPSPLLRQKAFAFLKGRLRQLSQVLLNISREGPSREAVTEEDE